MMLSWLKIPDIALRACKGYSHSWKRDTASIKIMISNCKFIKKYYYFLKFSLNAFISMDVILYYYRFTKHLKYTIILYSSYKSIVSMTWTNAQAHTSNGRMLTLFSISLLHSPFFTYFSFRQNKSPLKK